MVEGDERAPPGTRIETTEKYFQAIEDRIREIIPDSQRDMIVDNIGLPARAYNYAFGDGTAIGINDGVVLVALKENHAPTATYLKKMRRELRAAFPEVIFYFQPADMVTQILNFGVPAQIDVRSIDFLLQVGVDNSGDGADRKELTAFWVQADTSPATEPSVRTVSHKHAQRLALSKPHIAHL